MTLRVILAGHNVDAAVLERAREAGVPSDQLTPETLSAAYARISRSPDPVDELRRCALVEVARARASNERIVFGMGHASVAEHAVFNFDVLGLSRLAIEELERFRLCSYTEKSQRYVRLEDDVLCPEEIRALGFEERFRRLLSREGDLYRLLLERLGEGASGDASTAAREDARYVTSLAVTGQLGLTANARSLERAIRHLLGHPLDEVRRLGSALLEPARRVAPSLIRHVDPGVRPEAAGPPPILAKLAAELLGDGPSRRPGGADEEASLLGHTHEGDTALLAALLCASSNASHAVCLARARSLSEAERRRLVLCAILPLSVHDPVPRAFETVVLEFELVVSAAAFGQLKRHRMATLLPKSYDPGLGVTMPEAVGRTGLGGEFARVIEESTRLFEEVARRCPSAAPYVLTQAHRRRVLLHLSARELHHFFRLRLDGHAQWDLRGVAGKMLALAREKLPLTFVLACGKDRFEEERARLEGQVL